MKSPVYQTLGQPPYSSISVVDWDVDQISPVHFHPTADEIYHVLGDQLFMMAMGNTSRATSAPR